MDGEQQNFGIKDLNDLVKRFLGLDQNIDEFEKKFQDHIELSQVIIPTLGIRIPTTITLYEAFTRAVFGQQLSTNAALSICNRFILNFGKPHSSGILCYPSPAEVYNSNESKLKDIGCSSNKARTILTFTSSILEGKINPNADIHDLREALLNIKGVGQWTADNALMRGKGWLNAGMHKDLGIRKKLQRLLSITDLPSEKETENWFSQFNPWRGLVATHLWNMRI